MAGNGDYQFEVVGDAPKSTSAPAQYVKPTTGNADPSNYQFQVEPAPKAKPTGGLSSASQSPAAGTVEPIVDQTKPQTPEPLHPQHPVNQIKDPALRTWLTYVRPPWLKSLDAPDSAYNAEFEPHTGAKGKKDTRKTVGTAEDTWRHLKLGTEKLDRTLYLAGAPFFMGYDKAKSLLTGKPTTEAQDWYFKHTVAPIDASIQSNEINPKTEKETVAGKVLGSFAQMAPVMGLSIATGGASALAGATEEVGMMGGAMAFALPQAINTYSDLKNRGVDELTALKTTGEQMALNIDMGLLPMHAPGGFVRRVATGAAGMVGLGVMGRSAYNAAVGQKYPKLKTPIFDPKQFASDALMGGVFGAFGNKGEAPESGVHVNVDEAAHNAKQAQPQAPKGLSDAGFAADEKGNVGRASTMHGAQEREAQRKADLGLTPDVERAQARRGQGAPAPTKPQDFIGKTYRVHADGQHVKLHVTAAHGPDAVTATDQNGNVRQVGIDLLKNGQELKPQASASTAKPQQPQAPKAEQTPPEAASAQQASAQGATGKPAQLIEQGQHTATVDVAHAKSGDYVSLDPSEIKVDAKRFQFKTDTDAEGVSNQLKGTKKWNQSAAGHAIVWQDNKGDLYVVDGHQRVALAKRLQAEGQNPAIHAEILKESDGFSAKDARLMGATKNLSEGGESTKALDVAKVLRDTHDTQAIKDVVPPNRTAYKDAQGLANLGENGWGMVLNGQVNEAAGAEVGQQISDHKQQDAALKYLAAHEPSNRNQARLMVEQIKHAGFEHHEQGGLFGTEDMADSLVAERAKVLDNATKRLRLQKKAFSTALVSKSDLESAGSKISAEGAQNARDEKARTIAAIEANANRKGPVSDALNDAAKAHREGLSVQAATTRFLESLKAGRAPEAEPGRGPGVEEGQSRPGGHSQESGLTQGDLAGPKDQNAQDLHDAQVKKDEALNGAGDNAPPPSADGGLFSDQAGQQDLVSNAKNQEWNDKNKAKAEIDKGAHEAATSPHNNKPHPSQDQIEAGNYEKGHVRVHGLDVSIENPKGSTRFGIDRKRLETVGSTVKAAYEKAQDPRILGGAHSLIESARHALDTGDHAHAKKELESAARVLNKSYPELSSAIGDVADGMWVSKMADHYGYVRGTEGNDGEHVDVFLTDHAADPNRDIYVVNQNDPKTGKFDEHKVVIGAKSVDDAARVYDRNYTKDWTGRESVTRMTVPEFKDWLAHGDLKKPSVSGYIPGKHYTEQEQYQAIIDDLRPDEINDLAKRAGAVGKTVADKRAALRDMPESDVMPHIEAMDATLSGPHPDKTTEEDWDYQVGHFPKPERSVNLTKGDLPHIPEHEAQARLQGWKDFAQRVGREEDHSNEVVLSLFDASGVAAKPWRDAGYDVRQYDIKLGDDLLARFPMSDIADIQDSGKEVVGVISQPPCTCFSSSGARWWSERHDAHDRSMVNKMFGPHAATYFSKPKEYTKALVSMVDAVIDFTKPRFTVLENPVGRIASEMGLPKPTLIFNPHDFGDPYTKKTQLWGNFNPDLPTANVEPTQGSLMHKLWSSAEKDEGARSQTPEGFAYALFMANHTSKLAHDAGEQSSNDQATETAPPKESAGSKASASTTEPSNGASSAGSTNTVFTQDAYEKARARLKAKLGRPNAGIDPEIMLDGITVAGYHIEAGARRFRDYAKAMVEDMGEQIRPYLLPLYRAVRDWPGHDNTGMDSHAELDRLAKEFEQQGTKTVEPPPEVEKVANTAALVAHLYDTIKQAHPPKTNAELRKEIAPFFDKKAGAINNAELKRGQEAMEAALVRDARERVTQYGPDAYQRDNVDGADRPVFELLVDGYAEQPLLNVRDSTSMRNQAYSTPAPLAYLAGRMAGIDRNATVFEPTAGTGMLLIGADPARAIVHELDPRRAELLRINGFEPKVTDALKDNAAPKSVDSVITNPPFGGLKKAEKFDGYTIKAVDHMIAARALQAMKDDGKAVLILGANRAPGEIAPKDRVFFNWLYSHYNVAHHFEVNGDLYSRQGASWPVRVISIFGRRAHDELAPETGDIKRADTWDQVYEQYQQAQAEARRLDAEFGIRSGAQSRPSGDVAVGAENGPSGVSGGASGQDRPTDQGGAKGGGSNSGGTSNGGRGAQPGAVLDGEPSPDIGGNDPDAVLNPVGAGEAAGNGAEPDTAGGRDTEQANAGGSSSGPVKTEAVNEFQAKYKPQSKGAKRDTLTPVNFDRPMQKALQELAQRVGPIDEYVRAKLGYPDIETMHKAFMAAQVDSVAAAIDRIDNGTAVVIADQTGMGKGRQAAAILRYALNSGHVPVFISEKKSLFSDMWGDLTDIGTTDLKPFIFNDGGKIVDESGNELFRTTPQSRKAGIKALQGGDLPPDANAVMLTYSQVNKPNAQRAALEGILPRAVVVMDEAHNAAGASQTGEFMQGIVQNSKGVSYLSATYAKRPENLAIYSRTSMFKAVDSPDQLYEALAQGGEPLQAVASAQLVRAGELFRRELSFDGISVRTVVDSKNSAKHAEMADHVTGALRAIVDADRHFHAMIKDLQKQLKDSKGRPIRIVGAAGNNAAAGVQHTAFTSVVHNFVNQLLLGTKADDAATRAIKALKDGQKPLIGVQNTMGSFLKSYTEQNGVGFGDELPDFTWRSILHRALDRTRRVKIEDEFGNQTVIDVPMSSMPALMQKAYQAASNHINSVDVDIPVSPIDWIRHRIEKAGFKPLEITGRKERVDYSGDTPTFEPMDTKEVNDKVRTGWLFKNGGADALILNQAGSTGISLHASERFKDQRQRHMIIAQAAGDINTFMQLLGRINRTGQVKLPEYSILATDLPAEKRPAAVLTKKLRSLNANTSGNTDSATSIEAPDIFNKYGDQVVSEYLDANPTVHTLLDVESHIPGVAKKATGRLALLPVEQQRAFYGVVESEYKQLIDYLDRTNQNDLEIRTFDFDAVPVTSKVLIKGNDYTSIFGHDAVLETLNIKQQGKPATSDEVLAQLRSVLGERSPKSYVEELASKVRVAGEGYEHGLRADIDTAEKDHQTVAAALDKLAKDDPKYKTTKDDFERTQGRLERAKGALKSFEEQRETWERRVRYAFEPGTLAKLTVDDHEYAGVVTALKNSAADSVDETRQNPYAPSKTIVQFLLNGALHDITLPFSRLYGESGAYGGPQKGDMRTIFDAAEASADERQHVNVVTGNMLRAFADLGRGRIISFTMRDGDVRQGILLPKNFNEERDVSQQVSLKRPAAATEFMTDPAAQHAIDGRGIATKDGSLKILPDIANNELILRTPKTRATGAKWFLDPELTKITGDFTSIGNRMEAHVPLHLMAAIAEHVMKKAALYAPADAKHIAEKIVAKYEDGTESDPAFWRDVPNSEASMSAEAAKRHVAGFMREWKDRPGVVVVRSMHELPGELRAHIGSGSVRGAFWRGKAYLVADQHVTPEGVEATLLHEIVGHYGLRHVLGSDFRRTMNEVYMAMPGDLRQRMRKLYFGDKFDPNNANHRATVAEEGLAHMAQSGERPGLVARVFGKIREWARRMGFKLRLNDADIAHLLERARKFVQNGEADYSTGPVRHAVRLARSAFDRKRVSVDVPTEASSNGFTEQTVADHAERHIIGKSFDNDSSRSPIVAMGHAVHDAIRTGIDGRRAVYALPDLLKHATLAVSEDGNRIYYAGMRTRDGLRRVRLTVVDAERPDGEKVPLLRDIHVDTPANPNARRVGPFLDGVKAGSEADPRFGRRAGDPHYVVAIWGMHPDGRVGAVATPDPKGGWRVEVFEPRMKGLFKGQRHIHTDSYAAARERIERLGFTAQFEAPKVERTKQEPLFEGGFNAPTETTLDWFRRKAQDAFIDLKRVQKAIEKTGAYIDNAMDAYLKQELYSGRAKARVDRFNEHYTDPLVKRLDESGISLGELDEYLYARHAPERNAQISKVNPFFEDGTGSGMTDEEAAAVMDRFAHEGKTAQLEELASVIDDMLEHRRRLLVSEGLEKQSTVDGWDRTYRHYVPLRGLDENAQERNTSGLPKRGKGFNSAGFDPRAYGRRSRAGNIVANVIAMNEATLVQAEKARVGRALLRLAQAHPNPEFWEVNKVQLKPSISKHTGLVEYRPDPTYKLNDNVLAVKVEGHEHHITFHGDVGVSLARNLKNIGVSDNPLVYMLGRTTRWLALMNTGANPGFMISNLERDAQEAFINISGTRAKGGRWKMLRDIGSAWHGIRLAEKGGEGKWVDHYREFKEAGAPTGWLDGYDSIDKRTKAIEKLIKQQSRSNADPRQLARHMIDWVETENEAIENATRLSVFVRAREAGMDRERAASLAKNITVNFNRKGEWGGAVNALYLFYNASVQGTARMLHALRHKRVRRVVGAIVALSVAQDIANRTLGGRDKDGRPFYDKIPSFVKDRNFIFMNPDGSGRYFTLAKPYGYGLFSTIGDTVGRAISAGLGDTTFHPGAEAANIAASFVGAFNPLGGTASVLQFISPTLLDPVVQLANNKNWTGREIYPDRNEYDPAPKPRSWTYWNNTSDWSKGLAQELNSLTGGDRVRPGWFDVYPNAIQHVTDFALGGAGEFVSNAVNVPTRLLNHQPLDTNSVPIVRKFMGHIEPRVDQSAYFDGRRSAYYARKEVQDARTRRDLRKLRNVTRDYATDLRMYPMYKATDSEIMKLHQAAKRIEASRLPASQKRYEKGVIQKRINGLMQQVTRERLNLEGSK